MRRFWGLATTATATFALTAVTVSLAVWWSQHAGAPQSVRPRAPVMESAAEAHAQLAPHRDDTVGPLPQGRRKGGSWSTYQNVHFKFALKYPVDVFALETGEANDNVRTFHSRDGAASLRVFAVENVVGITLAHYRRSLIEERYAGVSFDHTRQRKFWFALSGTRGDKVFYERVTFACDGKSIHGWQMIYPLSERTLYDFVADEVHRNYVHTGRASARCGGLGRDRARAAGPTR